MTSRRRGLLALAGLLLAGLVLAPLVTPHRPRVLVLGLDGLDPRTVDLLMSEGKLPSFARLRQEGAYGRLKSQKPLLSPVVWTTVATGKTPDQHGIGHFVAVDEKTGEALPVTSEMRRVKAVWDIVGEAGRKVGVVGWWATWPAPKVNGFVVSDHTCYHFLFPQAASGDSKSAHLTHPPELFERISPLVRRPADVRAEEAAPFIQVPAADYDRPFAFDDDVSHFRWALATAESYRRIGLQLWKQERPDLQLVYTEGTDSVSHLFGHLFRAGELAGELAEQQRRYGQAVEQIYLYADRLLGEWMGTIDSDTTLVVLSDHGFELGVRQDDPSKTRDMRRVSELFHNDEGILYLYGRGVRRGRLERSSILDITPTVLALLGVPSAKDMPGRVLTEALTGAVPGPVVASYETGAKAGPAGARDASVDPEILERLQALGYIGAGKPAPGSTLPGGVRSPKGERNLAALLFEQKRYQEAADAYARLVKDAPDDASLRTSLAGCLGALGRFDEAGRELDAAVKLEPLNVEAYHNRAVIHERQGQKEKAIEQYRTALKYDAQYEASRQALIRLTGSAEVRAPRSESEKQAAPLLEQAADAARRGDYPAALRHLDAAEKLAPGWVLVFQYRSNVAYLMKDMGAAERALLRALELEPDNALFQRNLKRLRQGRNPGR